MQAPDSPVRGDLLDLYKIAVDEYRFEVRLNWDRMHSALTLNIAIISAGVGLLRLGGASWAVGVATGFIFLCGFIYCVIGMRSVKVGQDYYRRTVFKKMLYERELGLLAPVAGANDSRANLAIGTTTSMDDAEGMFRDPARQFDRPPLRRGTIVWMIILALKVLGVIDVLCMAVSIALAIGSVH